MESFSLNKSNPSIVFSLKGSDSTLHIKQIALITTDELMNDLSSVISSFELRYELKYIVYVDPAGRFIDERTKSAPITITVDPYQKEPIFDIDQKIKNETFTLGINPNQKWYQTLKIEFNQLKPIEQEFEFKFFIELH